MSQAERVVANLAEQIKTLILEKAILEANYSLLKEELEELKEQKETPPPDAGEPETEAAPNEALF